MLGITQQIRRAMTSAVIARGSSSTGGDMNTMNLYVTNIPWTVGKRDLSDYFTKFGPVSSCDVIFNTENGFSRGFGFVTFRFSYSYKQALETKLQMLEGNLLEISPQKRNTMPRYSKAQ